MLLAIAVLQDTTRRADWSNVAWYLGRLGFPEAFDPLRAFIWGAHEHSDSMRYMPGALHSAQKTMGHLAASNPRAMHYLIESTNPSYWKNLPWQESPATGPEFRLAMSEASIEALGLSGAPEAGQMLARLRQSPYKEAQLPTIEEALRTFHRTTLLRRYPPGARSDYLSFHLPEILRPTNEHIDLIGAWRWMKSVGPWNGYSTPPACGWSRTLFLDRDSTYSFWEQDSVGDYRVCSGRYASLTSARWPGVTWLRFEGWASGWVLGSTGTFGMQFRGPDLLVLDPGSSPDVSAADADPLITYVREPEGVSPPDSARAGDWRPPRVSRSTIESYAIELPMNLRRLLWPMSIRQWGLSAPRGLVPKCYPYKHFQIPSGVIGDFDGDSLADVAIFGYDAANRNEIVCILSNHGHPRAEVVWAETRSARPKKWRSRPSFYLERCEAGSAIEDPEGHRLLLRTDAIYTITADGERSVLYFGDGIFHRGAPHRASGGK